MYSQPDSDPFDRLDSEIKSDNSTSSGEEELVNHDKASDPTRDSILSQNFFYEFSLLYFIICIILIFFMSFGCPTSLKTKFKNVYSKILARLNIRQLVEPHQQQN